MLLIRIFKFNNIKEKQTKKEKEQKRNKIELYVVSQIIRAKITQAALKVSAKRIQNLIKVGNKVKVLPIQRLQKKMRKKS